MAFKALARDIDEYLHGKLWYWYIPLMLLGIYAFFGVLRYDPNTQPSIAIMPAQSFDFWMHELAHIATAMLPALITAASGSLSELLLGSVLIFGAFKTRCYFAAMFCCLWMMLACQSVGIYMADARAQRLDLVSLGGALSGGDTVIHDWNYIFGKLNLLRLDRFIGGSVRVVGVLIGLFGLGFALWLMIRMAGEGSRPKVSSKEQQLLNTEAYHALKSDAPVRLARQNDAAPSLYPVAIKGRLSDDPVPAPSPKDNVPR
jgi:hypothetical protein